jgi:surfeit locus 1 family protein
MTLVSARGVVLVAALVSVGLTTQLGRWQLGRAEAKRAAQAELAWRSQLPPWGNADWPCAPSVLTPLPMQQPVRLTGRWWPERSVLLENRPMAGRTGFIVLTPLRLSSSAHADCSGRVVLVQRGWVPRDAQDRLRLPSLPSPAGEVVVSGRLMAEPSRLYALGEEALPQGAGPVVRQNTDAAFWRAWIGQSPVAGAVLQLQAEGVQSAASAVPGPVSSDGLLRDWPAPDLGQGKHLAYAAQWFAMAALIMGLYVWHQLIRPRRALAHGPAQH